MRTGIFNQIIYIGDFIVYGIERSSLNYGLVYDVKEGADSRYNKIVVARLVSNSRHIYDRETDNAYCTPCTELTVKLSTTGNLYSSVIVPPYILEEAEEFTTNRLVLHRSDILSGVKKFAIRETE